MTLNLLRHPCKDTTVSNQRKSMNTPQLPAISGVIPQSFVDRAAFPTLYIAARNALQACERVDECKDLQDKYDALARYAKQAQNEELWVLARKVALRAERRMGEILDSLPKSKGGPNSQGHGTYPHARSMGIGPHRVTRALTIGRMSVTTFESCVDSEHPPGRQELAKIARGMGPRTAWSHQRTTVTTLKHFVRFWETHPPETLLITDPKATAEVRTLLLKCEEQLRALAQALNTGESP